MMGEQDIWFNRWFLNLQSGSIGAIVGMKFTEPQIVKMVNCVNNFKFKEYPIWGSKIIKEQLNRAIKTTLNHVIQRSIKPDDRYKYQLNLIK